MIARKSFHLLGLMANCKSIKNKDLIVHEYLVSNNIDFGIFTKAWLLENSDDILWCVTCPLQNCDILWCVTCPLQNCGFNILTSNQKSRRGGSLAFVYREALRWTLFRKVNYHLSSLPFGGLCLGTSMFLLFLFTDHHTKLPIKSLMHSSQQTLQSGSPASLYNTKIQ